MPRARSAEKVIGRHFAWLLSRRLGVWYADGRSNGTNAGRHSLGTRDKTEALQRLHDLDEVIAVRTGVTAASTPAKATQTALPLEEGQRLYLEHVARPRVLRGVRLSSQKRYRAVLKKFVAFARTRGLTFLERGLRRGTPGLCNPPGTQRLCLSHSLPGGDEYQAGGRLAGTQ